MADYVPDRGDLVWLEFSPQKGHEQKGKRPAIVLSPREYNKKTRLAIFCPITSQIKKYPFEVKINSGIVGVILSDQVRSLDWTQRNISFICKAMKKELMEVQNNIKLLIF